MVHIICIMSFEKGDGRERKEKTQKRNRVFQKSLMNQSDIEQCTTN